MVSHCRAEDLPASSVTFSRYLASFEEREGRCFSVVEGDVTVMIEDNSEAETENKELWSRENCTTPTAKECRIPEIQTCPPAPRKRRGSSFSRSPSVRVKEYFVPPNLESIFVLDKVSKVK